jgi:hypothetical protein
MQWCHNFNVIFFLNIGISIQIYETVMYLQEMSTVYKRLA